MDYICMVYRSANRGALGLSTLIAFLETEEDGYISKLLKRRK